MIELDTTDFKSYLRQTLEVCLHVMKSDSDNDYYIDIKNNIDLVNKSISNFINGVIKSGKKFDDVVSYIVDYCGIDSVRKVLSPSLNDVIDMVKDLNNDPCLFVEQSINIYLSKLQEYNLAKVYEKLNFPEERNKDKQKIISYLNLWHFCKSRNDDFKDFILEQVFDLSKELKEGLAKSDFEKLLIINE